MKEITFTTSSLEDTQPIRVRPAATFPQSISALGYILAFTGLLGGILVVLISLDIRLPNPLALVRLLLGPLFVLFFPGFVLQAAIFPDRRIWMALNGCLYPSVKHRRAFPGSACF
jgi:uncharacterized membrane protein